MTTPSLAESSRGRWYVLPSGRYPSVTTIISALEKPALPRWAAKAVAQYAVGEWRSLSALIESDPDAAVDLLQRAPWRSTERAADLGTHIHEIAEALAGEAEMPDIRDEAQPYVEGFLAAVEEHDIRPSHVEVTVAHRTLGYAGTADMIATVDGVPAVVDIKTGKGVYAETALQLSAYRHAEILVRDGQETPMPAVEAGYVLHVRPRRTRLLPVSCGEDEFAAFVALQSVWTWLHERSRGVIG